MKKTKKLVCVGGGFSSTHLAKLMSQEDDFEVILIAPSAYFEYHGAIYRSAVGFSPLEAVVPFSEIFKNKKVNIINDYVLEIRAESSSIACMSGEILSYDILALGVGYEPNYFQTKGIEGVANTIYSMKDSIELRLDLVKVFRSKQKEIIINVIGAGPTGIEVASNINYFANHYCDFNRINKPHIIINILEASDGVLKMLDHRLSAKVCARLEELGINIILNATVEELKGGNLITSAGKLKSDLTIWSAGSKANRIFTNYPDLFNLSSRGKVMVDSHLKVKGYPIYVMGDSAETQFSGMAQTALLDAEFLHIHLRGGKLSYSSQKPKYIIPVGHEWAAAQLPNGKLYFGEQGWHERRNADLKILETFLSKKLADQHWQKGNIYSQYCFI
jgi:NADH dehydrogenase